MERPSDLPKDLPHDLPHDLKIIRHPRATRMKLRLDRKDGAPVLVLPPRASLSGGHAFVREHLGWLAAMRGARPAARAFADSVSFPFQDGTLQILHRPEGRIGVQRKGDCLYVSGAADHLNRRVTDWLKRQARTELSRVARQHADTIGTRIARIRVADQISRWGSCSSKRVLSFNWRLIMAPPFVLDFVAAHEVAHMVHMNHGPDFHALEARLHPNPGRADAWLKANAADLRSWGQPG